MQQKRLTYFDMAKGFGIILVVLGHIEYVSEPLRAWISSFHMPLFFMISGMLIALKQEDEKDLQALIVKKAKGIIVPYLWFSLIYIPIDIMNLYINNVDMHTFIQNILDSATFSGVSVMWFLPALFIAEVTVLYLMGKLKGILKDRTDISSQTKLYVIYAVVFLVVSIFAFLIWNCMRNVYDENSGNYVLGTLLGFVRVILRGICMSFHVAAGFIMFKIMESVDLRIEDKYSEKIDKEGTRTGMASNSVLGRLFSRERRISNQVKGLNMCAGVVLFVINISLCLKNGAVDNHFLTLNNLFYYYLCALIGSLSIVLICKGFDSIKSVEFLGKNSLIIMATHLQCYLLYAGILVAIAIDVYITRAKSYVYMFNSVLFTMLFETVVIIVINKFFPFITGKGSIKDLLYFVKGNKQN